MLGPDRWTVVKQSDDTIVGYEKPMLRMIRGDIVFLFAMLRSTSAVSLPLSALLSCLDHWAGTTVQSARRWLPNRVEWNESIS